MYYQIYRLVQGAFFYTPVSLFSAAIFSDYSQASFGRVQRLMQKFRQKHKSSQSEHLSSLPHRVCCSAIETAFRRNHQVCYLTMAGNQQVFGRITACFLLANIPVNIHCVSQLVLAKNGTYETIIFSLIIFYQFLTAWFVFYPSAKGTMRLHEPAKMMPLMVGLMGGQKWLPLKLKMDDLFYRLTWGPRIAAQVGPIKQITYQSTLDVSEERLFDLLKFIKFFIVVFRFFFCTQFT